MKTSNSNTVQRRQYELGRGVGFTCAATQHFACACLRQALESLNTRRHNKWALRHSLIAVDSTHDIQISNTDSCSNSTAGWMCARKFWRYPVLPRAGRRSADGPFGRPGILPYFQITPFFFPEALWFKTMTITICKRDEEGGGGAGCISHSRPFPLPRNIGMCRQLFSAFPTTHFRRLQLRMWQHTIALHWLIGTESNRTTTRWQLKASEDGSVVTGLYFAARVTFRREGTDYINLLLDPTYEHASSMKSETLQPPTGIRPPGPSIP